MVLEELKKLDMHEPNLVESIEKKSGNRFPVTCSFVTLHKKSTEVYTVKIDKASTPEASLCCVSEWPNMKFELAVWSPCGNLLGLCNTSKVLIVSTASNYTSSIEIPTKPCQSLFFSPLGTYLVTVVLKDNSGQTEIKIFDSRTGALNCVFVSNTVALKRQPLMWSPNENYAFLQHSSVLKIFSSKLTFGIQPVETLRYDMIQNISVAPQISTTEDDNNTVKFSVCSKSKAKKTGTVSIFFLTNPETKAALISDTNFFYEDNVKMQWNYDGTSLLIGVYSDIDRSSQSYYGNSHLYHAQAFSGGNKTLIISQEDGPVHDFRWSPTQNKFIVIFGKMPPKIYLYDGKTGIPKLSFGNHSRNSVRFNIWGKLISIGGFGNLPGDIEIWDIDKKKVIGKAYAHGTTNCEWSPDGRLLLCSTTTPQLRVDNCVQIFRYNGDRMIKHSISELYVALWKPEPPGVFASRSLSPERLNNFNPANTISLYRLPNESDESYARRKAVLVEEYQTVAKEICSTENEKVVGAEYVKKSKSSRRNMIRRQKAKEKKNAELPKTT